MFDELVGWLVLSLVVAVVGWLLGVIAFFRSKRALREIVALRASLQLPSLPLAAPVLATPMPEPILEAIEDPADEPELAPLPAPVAAPKRRSFDLEELLTARWGVWLGSAALLFAGVFLVRYAAEEGWLGPAVRCLGLVALGLGLIGAGLALARQPARGLPFPDQTPAALGAGGVVLTFLGAYAATVLYALVPPVLGLCLMAAASLAGLLVALRLGQLVAAVGIVGAFVTPALVQSADPSLPGLFAYLLFVAAASLAVVRYAAWIWLGWATTIAGAAWVALASLAAGTPEIWAPALFVPALAAVHLALLPGAALDHRIGRKLAWVPVVSVGAAGLLLAVVEPSTVARAGVLLLAPVTLVKAAREARLAVLPWVAALLFLLVVASWGLPSWSPTGEPIGTGERVVAVLPGDWTPAVLRPLLLTTLLMSVVFAAAGLAGERRFGRPLAWASLTAAVPVLALAVAYARVRAFQPDAAWSGVALVLALLLTGAAALAARDGARQRAGVHAAGATAALALGFAMLLTGQWLTIALVLLMPALAWIEARADLPPLRRVALALASVALVRLLLNEQVLDYADGQPAVLNGRALAYLVAASSFALTARMARRRADDRLVAVLEVGSAGFATALVMLEIRQWATSGQPRVGEFSFLEAALQVSSLAVLACLSLWLDRRGGRAALRWAWGVQGALALLGGVGLLLLNPMFVDVAVGGPPILDALLPGYAIPAVLAMHAARNGGLRPAPRGLLSFYSLLAAFAWVTLEVRHIAHPGAMTLSATPVLDGELWAWSGARMVLAVALMVAGLAGQRRAFRLAALAVMALVTAKVFLVDMAGLTGLWRVLSFLGLGLTLIGLGRLYGRFARTGPTPLKVAGDLG